MTNTSVLHERFHAFFKKYTAFALCRSTNRNVLVSYTRPLSSGWRLSIIDYKRSLGKGLEHFHSMVCSTDMYKFSTLLIDIE